MLVPIPLVMRGVPAQIFFAVPGDGNVKQANWGEKQVELTLDHPLQVKLELDLLAGVDDVDELEEGKEAQSCQRPKRPHQNFHFQQNNVKRQKTFTPNYDKSSQNINSTLSRKLGH